MTPTLPLPDAPGLDGPVKGDGCLMCDMDPSGSGCDPYCSVKCKAHDEGRTILCEGCGDYVRPEAVREHAGLGKRCEPCRCICTECGEEEIMPCTEGVCVGCTANNTMAEALDRLRKCDRMSISDTIGILERFLEES